VCDKAPGDTARGGTRDLTAARGGTRRHAGPDGGTAGGGTGDRGGTAGGGTGDLTAVEARLRTILEPYRASLETADLYGVETLQAPGAKAHDWFAGVKRASAHVSFFLLPIVTHPELLDDVSPELLRRKTAKSCFSFRRVEEPLLAELEQLTARSYERFSADRAPRG
jgi:hypothetical protein